MKTKSITSLINNKNGKKWLFFDVGYTLVNEDDVWKTRCLEQVELPQQTGYKKLSPNEFNEILKIEFMKNTKYKQIVKNFGYMDVVRFPYEQEKLYANTPQILDILSNKFNLGIIANQDKGLNERLKNLGILRYFTVIIGSDDVGLCKPNKEIFELALSRANCKPENAYMIGDRLDNDIAPAKMLGMKTIRFLKGYRIKQEPSCNEQIPDFTIADLKQLLELDL